MSTLSKSEALSKRHNIALSFWYERQGDNAHRWMTRHPKSSLRSKRWFASYISWKFMGGPEKWWAKALSFCWFWLTRLLMTLPAAKRS